MYHITDTKHYSIETVKKVLTEFGVKFEYKDNTNYHEEYSDWISVRDGLRGSIELKITDPNYSNLKISYEDYKTDDYDHDTRTGGYNVVTYKQPKLQNDLIL